jgi:hypothetical protein
MRLRFIDVPQPAAPQQYEAAIEQVVSRLADAPGLAGIIRFGHLTTPGISDIDLLAVFDDGAHCAIDPLAGLAPAHRRLFTHGVDAMSHSFFRETADYTFWFNSRCIAGDAQRMRQTAQRSPADEEALKVQTAMEYVVTNFIDLTLQRTYGIVKLRAMLQHLKGLHYDFEFLKIDGGPVVDAVLQLRSWIADWHEQRPAPSVLAGWIEAFYGRFRALAYDLLRRHPVYVPRRPAYRYARNVLLVPSDEPGYERKGLLAPAGLAWPHRRFYNLQHRFNRWTFRIPMRHEAPAAVEKRFDYFRRMKRYNAAHFPAFSHLTTGFSVHFD